MRKAVFLCLLCVSLSAAATLTSGRFDVPRPKASTAKIYSSRTFTLKSTWSYRGAYVFSPQRSAAPYRYVAPSQAFTYQKGNTTFIAPLKSRTAAQSKIRFAKAGEYMGIRR